VAPTSEEKKSPHNYSWQIS